MKITILAILIRQLVHDLSQADVAEALAISEPKLSRILNGHTDAKNVEEDTFAAFTVDHPILDALLLGSKSNQVITDYDRASAPAIASMAEDAMSGASSDRAKLKYSRTATVAHITAGADYHYYPEDNSHVMTIADSHLMKAEELLEGQIHFHVPDEYREVMSLTIEQNKLAISMLREKGSSGGIRQDGTLIEFKKLLKQAVETYRSLGAASIRSDQRKNQEKVLRALILYAAAAVGEMLLETGQNDQIQADAIEPALQVFEVSQLPAIHRLMIEMAWHHNQPGYLRVLNNKSVKPSAKVASD